MGKPLLPEHILSLAAGDRVRHPLWPELGLGVIESINASEPRTSWTSALSALRPASPVTRLRRPGR